MNEEIHVEKYELGLPLEYKKLPEFFDAHNMTNKTEITNRVIEKLLRKHDIRTVLDFSCKLNS